MTDDLQARLHDLAAIAVELSNEHLALAERHAAYHDELEQLANDLYADEQDAAVVVAA